MSVDEQFGSHEDAVTGMGDTWKELGLDIPYVIAPGGFAETHRLWGIDEYSTFVVGPDGLVKGADLRNDEIEGLLGG